MNKQLTENLYSNQYTFLPKPMLIEVGIAENLMQFEAESLVDKSEALRKNLSLKYGFNIPTICFYQHSENSSDQYVIKIRNVPVFKYKTRITNFQDMLLELLELFIERHIKDLITREEVSRLLSILKTEYPILVKELSSRIHTGQILEILRSLLCEKIPIIDLLTIMETIDYETSSKFSKELLVERIRSRLSRTISTHFSDQDNTMNVLVFDSQTENQLLINTEVNDSIPQLKLSSTEISNIVEATSQMLKEKLSGESSPIIIVNPLLRHSLSQIYKLVGMDISVLTNEEVGVDVKVNTVGTITIEVLIEKHKEKKYELSLESVKEDLKKLERVHEIDTRLASLSKQLGYLHLKRKEYSEALESLQKSLELDGDDPETIQMFCEALLLLGNGNS